MKKSIEYLAFLSLSLGVAAQPPLEINHYVIASGGGSGSTGSGPQRRFRSAGGF